MKKLSLMVLIGLAFMVTPLYAHEGEDHSASEKVTVYTCPMDGYTVPAKCPHCGMKMDKKEMTAADAQAAIDKTKEQMRNR